MGRLQSRVIGEVVALVVLLSGIALSSENTVQYGQYYRKLGSRFSRLPLYLLLLGLPLLPPLTGLVLGSVTANAVSYCITPPHHPPGTCSLLIGWFSLLWPCAQWLGLAVGALDLPLLLFTEHALLLVLFWWVYSLSFRLPHTY